VPKRRLAELIWGAVIGAGLIGTQRATDFISLGDNQIAYVCDPDPTRGNSLAQKINERQSSKCEYVEDVHRINNRRKIDLAFVAVPHHLAARIVLELLKDEVNILVEKPMGLTIEEAGQIATLAENSSAKVAVGFNYRHYPAVVRAKEIISEGFIGKPLFLRMILGHGGRPGYEKEWKLSRAQCGGGALLDPGIHLLDLGRFFLGQLRPVQSHLARLHWPIDVEDCAVAVLQGADGAEMYIQTSILEWQNSFSVHIVGDQGYLTIDGRMKNYGPQKLVYGKKWAWLERGSQADAVRTEDFGDKDTSFLRETELVVRAVETGGSMPSDHHDGLESMKLIDQLYRLSTFGTA
jgi:predicted dehydrogenase